MTRGAVDADPLGGFYWNEAEAGTFDEILDGLLAIAAVTASGHLKLIGSAFVVAAYGDHAVAISAAHNIRLGIAGVQVPHSRSASSALAEFLPHGGAPQIEPEKIRVLQRSRGRPVASKVSWAVWDERSDVAILGVRLQELGNDERFEAQFGLDSRVPKAGDTVAVLGYANMSSKFEDEGNGIVTGTLQLRPTLRMGKVREEHPGGHILCRGACVETTIPVFGGMSGGLACLLPEAGQPIAPFGFISTDPEEPEEQKMDRSKPGNSILGCLPLSRGPLGHVGIRIENLHRTVDPTDEFQWPPSDLISWSLDPA
ncbi:MAG: trypsin-like peptidase domain-containing protein [Caulobacteraceae bacterium]|nr:trypsin-like peptidase domain-containing protein [Caulobacteraceae bacterium]